MTKNILQNLVNIIILLAYSEVAPRVGVWIETGCDSDPRRLE